MVSAGFQTSERRRGGRVLMRVPIHVRGTAEDGNEFEEAAHTEAVSARGSMARIPRQPKMGSEMAVTNRFSQQTAKFRVAWLGKKPADGLWEVGIEAIGPLEDFWGLRFPSEPAS